MKASSFAIALAIIGVVMISGCIEQDGNVIRQTGDCITPSGELVKETRDVDSFKSVIVGGPSSTVHITQGTTNSLEIEATENVLAVIETTVEGDTLNIVSSQCIQTTIFSKPINIYITTPEVDGLTMAGSGKIVSSTGISSDDLNLILSGSGTIDLEIDSEELETLLAGSGIIKLKGEATEHRTTLSGSGTIRAYDLVTNKTIVTISGSGNAYVYAIDELSTQVTGSGSIHYKKQPKIINKIE
jgi:hypothetical protein